MYDPNQNKYIHFDGNMMTALLSSSVTNINHATSNSQPQTGSCHHHHQLQHVNGNANSNCANNKANVNGNANGLPSNVLHPALLNIINEAQGMKFRGKHTNHIEKTKCIHKASIGTLYDILLEMSIHTYIVHVHSLRTRISPLDIFFS